MSPTLYPTLGDVEIILNSTVAPTVSLIDDQDGEWYYNPDFGAVFGLLSLLVNTLAYTALLSAARKPVRQLSFHARLNLLLGVSARGKILEIYIAFASILTSSLFVWETYEEDAPPWTFFAELFFSISFLIQYFVDFYTSHNQWAFIRSVQAIVDKVTVLPVLFMYLSGLYLSTDSNSGELGFSRIMKFTRVLRLLRLFRSSSAVSSATDDAIHHQLIRLTTTLLSILVVTTGMVQFLSNEVASEQWETRSQVCPSQRYKDDGYCVMDFHESLYFTVSLISTSGYGDIAPSGTIGRLAITTLIASAFVLVPLESSRLFKLMAMRSPYSGRFKQKKGESFVVVVCDEFCTGVGDFIAEFYHDDHGSLNLKVILLIPSEPTNGIKEILLRHKQITYLKGDAMSSQDLIRANVDNAAACFMLSNRFAKDTNRQDATTILRVLNLKRFNPEITAYAQIIEPENKVHVVAAGLDLENIVCCNEVKFGVLGIGAALPGFSTLLVNLVSSMGNLENFVTRKWHEEYASGLIQEIYSLECPEQCYGLSFCDASWIIFKNYGVMLFGAGVRRKAGSQSVRVILNPGKNFEMRKGLMILVIANDAQTVDKMFPSDTVNAANADLSRSHRVPKGMHALEEEKPIVEEPKVEMKMQNERLLRATRKAMLVGQMRNAVTAVSTFKTDHKTTVSAVAVTPISPEVDDAQSPTNVEMHSITQESEQESESSMGVFQNLARKQSDLSMQRKLLTGPSLRLKETLRRIKNEFYDADENAMIQDVQASLNCMRHFSEAPKLKLASIQESTQPQQSTDLPKLTSLSFSSNSHYVTRAELAVIQDDHGVVSSIHQTLRQHFVLMCACTDGLEYLVAPIRLHYPNKAIVILCPKQSTRQDWNRLLPFGNIYYLKGTRQVSDMKCASIDYARCAICLTEQPTASEDSELISHHFSSSDAEVILNVLDVETNPMIHATGIQTICELNSNRYINGLGAQQVAGTLGLELQQSNGINYDLLSSNSYLFDPSYAKGKVVASNFLESLLCQVFFNPYIIAAVEAIIAVPQSGDGSTASKKDFGDSGYFDMLAVPKSFAQRPYRMLVRHLLCELDTCPLGLFRLDNASNTRFVMTNPPHDTLVGEDDKVYVMMPRP